MDIIKVSNLSKTYKTYERGSTFSEVLKSFFKRQYVLKDAVKNVSLTVEQGSILGLIGPNGAGKSTMIKMLTGVLYPSSGEVKVLDYIPWKQRSKYVSNIGAVFGQKSQLLWDIPPVDAFNMNKAIYGVADSDYKEILEELVSVFEIEDVIKKPTRVLSLGERMKCEFVMAMIHSPSIVFLDEPTIGLDIIAKEKIREFIKKMNKKGTTFILTTHDIGDIERLADKVIVINYGEIVFNDSLDSLKKYLGDKKIVNVIMKSEFNGLNQEGVSIVDRPSLYEVNLEVDSSIINMNQFIDSINKSGEILDISIKELPIENIIKKLYQDEYIQK